MLLLFCFKLLPELLFGLALLGGSLELAVHFIEHLVDVLGLEAPTEILVVDLDGVLAGFGCFLCRADDLLDADLLLGEVVLDSSYANPEIGDLLAHIEQVVERTSDPLEEHEHLHDLGELEVVAHTEIDDEGEGAHQVWQEVPDE